MSVFQQQRYPLPPRRLPRRRRWVWAGFVLAVALLGALAGISGALLLGGLGLLLVALVALIRPRWVGARTRAVAAVVAAIGLAGTVAGTAVAGATVAAREPSSPPPAATSAPSATPSESTAEPTSTPTTTPSSTPTTRSTAQPTTTPTATPTQPKAAAGTALAAVDQLRVKGRAPKTGYERSAYGNGWNSVDGCSTREMILRRDLGNVTVAQSGDCAVISGTLHDPYTGKTERLTAATLQTADVDHVVALGDSWQKGAQQWSRAKRNRFANDPLNLVVTTESVNASKSDGDTATWLPPDKSFRCTYVARQVSVKKKYDLWVTSAEKQAMITVLSRCADQKLITEKQAEQQRDRHATVTKPKSAAKPAKTTKKSSPAPTTDVRYPTCAAANRAGLGPYVRGADPEYDWYRDRDGDGIVCER